MTDRSPRRSLAAMIICCNEADRIEACLQSLAGWVDEIVVVDSGSTDGTEAIARRYTDRVWITSDWPGYGVQRNRALDHVQSDWVLYIDADERVTPELRHEIDQALSQPQLDRTLFKISWRCYLFGGEIRHGRYTSPQNRLFLREGARFREHLVHEQVVLPVRRSAVLQGKIEHHSWRDYEHLRGKHRRYAQLLAQHKFEQGERGSLPYACLRMVVDFLQQYVLRLGFLDGWRGLVMSFSLGQYAYWKYADLRSLELARVKQPAGSAAAPPMLRR